MDEIKILDKDGLPVPEAGFARAPEAGFARAPGKE